MKRIQSLLTLAFALATVAVNAQDKLHVKGKVLSTKNTPIEFTSVVLENKEDGAVIEVIADEKGDFILEAPEGKYILIIEPLGYGPVEKEIEILSDLDLGTFAIKSSETVSLATAVIKAEKPVYKVELDKKVYDMASDPMSQGLSLSDALQNVPSVQVDAEGGVSLRGNDNVKFLIDGKPSGMLGVSDIGEALKNIPAENVERIEVITNPSSRYEASGSGGIINIVLKKGTNTGFNGSVTGNLGHPDMAGLNVNLNYKTKKFNWYTTLGTRYSDRNGEGSALLTNYDDLNQPTSFRTTDRRNDRIRRNYNVRLGTEYYLDNKNTIGLSAGYRYNNGNNNSLIDYYYYGESMNFLRRNYNTQREKQLENNFDTDFNFKHEFDKKGQEFVFTARYSYQKEDENGSILNYGPDAINPSLYSVYQTQDTKSLDKQNTVVLTADYVLPFSEKGKFELGARADFNNTKTLAENYFVAPDGTLTPNPDFFSNVDNQQNVLAAYAQYGNVIGKLQYFAGLRLEHSDIDINFYNIDKKVKKKYTDLFPTATLNYSFDNKNELQLSYSRRIRRPMGFMLMPFFTSTDDRNRRYGNPDLNPTYTNSLELSYITTIGKLMVTPSLFYQRTTDLINQFQRKDYSSTGEEIFITMPVNAGSEDRYGLDLTSTYKPFKWWNLMLNVNLFGYDRKGSYSESNLIFNPDTGLTEPRVDIQNFSGNGFSSRGRLSSNFILPADFKIQVAGNYMGQIKTAQQTVKDNFSMDLSVSKDLFDKKATLALNVRDLLDTRKREMTQYGIDYSNYESMRWMVRSINLSFTYRFKNTNDKPKGGKRPEGMEGEDMREGGEIGAIGGM